MCQAGDSSTMMETLSCPGLRHDAVTAKMAISCSSTRSDRGVVLFVTDLALCKQMWIFILPARDWSFEMGTVGTLNGLHPSDWLYCSQVCGQYVMIFRSMHSLCYPSIYSVWLGSSLLIPLNAAVNVPSGRNCTWVVDLRPETPDPTIAHCPPSGHTRQGCKSGRGTLSLLCPLIPLKFTL